MVSIIIFCLISIGQFVLIFIGAFLLWHGDMMWYLFYTPIGFLAAFILAFTYHLFFERKDSLTVPKMENIQADDSINKSPIQYVYSSLLYLPAIFVFINNVIISQLIFNTDSLRYIHIAYFKVDLDLIPIVAFLIYLIILFIFNWLYGHKWIWVNITRIKFINFILVIWTILVICLSFWQAMQYDAIYNFFF